MKNRTIKINHCTSVQTAPVGGKVVEAAAGVVVAGDKEKAK